MQKLLTIGIVTFEETIFLYELLSNLSKQIKDYQLNDKCDVIIVNDGGKNPETHRILDMFSDSFNVIFSESNSKSPSDSRNKIIDLSDSKYLLFMDGDDNFVDSIEKVCNELETSETKDIFVSRVKKIINEGSLVEASFIFTNQLFSMSDEQFELNHHKVVVHQTGIWSIYNVSFLRENNIYYDSKVRYEDNIFMSIIALVDNVRYGRIYTSYYGWRLNLLSFSHSENKKIIEHRVNLYIKILELVAKNPDNKYAPYLLYSVWNQTYGNINRVYPSGFSKSDFKFYLEKLNKISRDNKKIIRKMISKTDDFIQFPYKVKKITRTYAEFPLIMHFKMTLYKLRKIHIKKWLAEKCLYLPLGNKKIFLTSQYGKYNDNSKYLYLSMKNDEKYKKYKFIFAVKDPELYKNNKDFINYNNKFLYYYHHFTAKYVYFNTWIDGSLKKRKNQVWIQLWHGYPYKKIFSDVENYHVNTHQTRKDNKTKSIANWDSVWSVDEKNTKIFRRLFPTVNIIEKEYPKVKWLIENKDNVALISHLKRKYNLLDEHKYILYAPTYRPYYYDFDINEVRSLVPEGFKLIIHTHPYVQANLLNVNKDDTVFRDISDIQEIVLLSDQLITDYSSLIHDFKQMNKKVKIYAPDKELYSKIHGIYN